MMKYLCQAWCDTVGLPQLKVRRVFTTAVAQLAHVSATQGAKDEKTMWITEGSTSASCYVRT